MILSQAREIFVNAECLWSCALFASPLFASLLSAFQLSVFPPSALALLSYGSCYGSCYGICHSTLMYTHRLHFTFIILSFYFLGRALSPKGRALFIKASHRIIAEYALWVKTLGNSLGKGRQEDGKRETE